MLQLITATSFALPENGIPDEIVYIPEGVHDIRPSVDGKPGKVTVKMLAEAGERIAAAFQSDLTKRLADNVRPIIDFDHKSTGPAAGIPKSFRYQPGKGLMMAVDWTRAGKEAIEGRDFSYSSPTFLLGDDGAPSGLPERGPVAALVNSPAFRSIQRIAASDQDHNPDTNHTEKMNKLILAALKVDDTRTDAETIGIQRIEAMQAEAAKVPALETENAELKKKVEAAETVAAAARKEKGQALFDRAVKVGLAAPKDDAKKAEFIEAAETENTFAVKLITQQIEAAEADPKNKDITRTIIKAGEDRGGSGVHEFERKAKALVTAKEAPSLSEAYSLVAASDPELYQSYEDSLA